MNATLNALKIHRIIEHTDFNNSWVLVEHWSSQLLSGAVLPSGVRHQGVVKASVICGPFRPAGWFTWKFSEAVGARWDSPNA